MIFFSFLEMPPTPWDYIYYIHVTWRCPLALGLYTLYMLPGDAPTPGTIHITCIYLTWRCPHPGDYTHNIPVSYLEMPPYPGTIDIIYVTCRCPHPWGLGHYIHYMPYPRTIDYMLPGDVPTPGTIDILFICMLPGGFMPPLFCMSVASVWGTALVL